MGLDGRRTLPHDEDSQLSTDLGHLHAVEIEPATLRFRDRALEADFRRQFFRDNLPNVRLAFLGGAALFVIWGVVLRPFMLAVQDKQVDLIVRYGVFIPLLLAALALSFTRWFERAWEWFTTAMVIAIILIWVYYVSLVVTTALATLFLTTFALVGGVVAYRTERATRLLFLRERQLQYEHERSEGLLLNILPRAIVDRLKLGPDGRVADALDEVSVVFADAVDSTEHAAITTPELFAETLDRLFRRFDDIADRHGLEKIKTIGDAYMGVAGAPVPVPDHAARTAEAALEMVEAAGKVRWPSGDAIRVRVGMASGPAVAGVIGQRKFAYDLWGDTVNIAARLEENGETGRILLTERMAQALSDRYEFGPLLSLDLKGKGPTPVRFLLGRIGKVSAPAAEPVTT